MYKLFKIYKISFPVNWISKSNWMKEPKKSVEKESEKTRLFVEQKFY